MKSRESVVLRSLLAELKNKGILEPEQAQVAGRALRALDHAVAVKDPKAVRKAVENFLRVFVAEGIIRNA